MIVSGITFILTGLVRCLGFRQSPVSSKHAKLSNITYAKFTGNIFIELTVLKFNARAARFSFRTKNP